MMNEERLKEIKELMDNEIRTWGKGNKFVNQHLELYNEVVRLRKIIKEATQRVEGTTICGLRAGKSVIGTYLNELLDILNGRSDE